ncbi:hypothetical protein [Nonomuraea diastatica]|uniref:Uncharacterized protein n=1 Tax=Nonomuraea diastatica TaxID=1848329 RepID=A0A4V2YDY4_9ACTN|nr:hypothetical protein [Nonomuraea diastatica]TDD17236.1 hypothetical protein E1294_28365 [Nonomuraea diastatica]
MNLTSKIDACVALIEHPNTPEPEREAARRLLERLKRRAQQDGRDASSTSEEWSGYYRLPTVQYGAKYEKWRPSAELAKLIRADIALARKLGRQPGRPGEMKILDPIGDAPASIEFSVRKEYYAGGRAIHITITGVPADWWIDKKDPYHRDYTWRAPGLQLAALRGRAQGHHVGVQLRRLRLHGRLLPPQLLRPLPG